MASVCPCVRLSVRAYVRAETIPYRLGCRSGHHMVGLGRDFLREFLSKPGGRKLSEEEISSFKF